EGVGRFRSTTQRSWRGRSATARQRPGHVVPTAASGAALAHDVLFDPLPAKEAAGGVGCAQKRGPRAHAERSGGQAGGDGRSDLKVSGASEAQPSDPGAGAQPPPGSGLGMLFPLLLLVPLLLMMFFSTRSQQKKQQAALAALKKGDRVLTQSGLVGKLVEMGDPI